MDTKQIQKEIDKMQDLIPALEYTIKEFKDIIILGNGGSSAIASHMAQDYTKALKKRAFTFSDSSRLTCYSNDYGYENAYYQFLKEFYVPKTLVILISSSGNSKNILRCKEFCVMEQASFIILSGFRKENMLRTTWNGWKPIIDYHVDSFDYGIVECCHQIFLHSVC